MTIDNDSQRFRRYVWLRIEREWPTTIALPRIWTHPTSRKPFGLLHTVVRRGSTRILPPTDLVCTTAVLVVVAVVVT